MSYSRSAQDFIKAVWQEPEKPRILIEGDSWTEHPLLSNLSWCLHLYFKDKVHILNISNSGDLIYEIAHGKQFKKLEAYLKSDHFHFDIMFLSGGGNDILLNNVDSFSLNAIIKQGTGDNPRNYIDSNSWKNSLDRIKDSFEKILSMSKSVNYNLKVVTHTYDYIYPRNKGTDVIVIPNAIGPWAWPVFINKGISDQKLQRSITSVLLDDFKVMLDGLTGTHKNLVVVDTLSTLPEVPDWSIKIENWDDEIHPDSRGFKSLVDTKIGPTIAPLLP